MDRTPYLGDVAVVVHPGKKEMGTPLADTPTRPVTRHGGMRDLHESSFSLSGKNKGRLDWHLRLHHTGRWEEAGGQWDVCCFPRIFFLPPLWHAQ